MAGPKLGAISDAEVLSSFPEIPIDQDNIDHYRGILGQRLLINRCMDCDYWIYPHRPMCPLCWSFNVKASQVSGTGVIYMFTLLHRGAPTPGISFDPPHPAAAIELIEQTGLRYLAPIVNCDTGQVNIGLRVQLTWVDRLSRPSPAFEPADATLRTRGAAGVPARDR